MATRTRKPSADVKDQQDNSNGQDQPVHVNPGFQEWEVKIHTSRNEDTGKVTKKAEMLKCKRERVLITEDQANILNEGVLNGPNTYAVMYFTADQVEQG